MDSLGDRTQMGQENPNLSPKLEKELFEMLIDPRAYSSDTETSDCSYQHHHRHHHHHHHDSSLYKLITEIPNIINFTQREREHFNRMASYQLGDEAVTPPDLVQGGSTSPSDHSGSDSIEEGDGILGPDASLGEIRAQDDYWTFPHTDPSKPAVQGYPLRLQVQEDQARKTAVSSPGLKRRRSVIDLDKRQRQLYDPAQTADVRKSGACLPCRVSKTRCHESGVCPKCRKEFPGHSHMACNRNTPSMFWPVMAKVPDVWSVTAKEEKQLCSDPRFYTGEAFQIPIFFARDANMPLWATVHAHQSQDGPEEMRGLPTAGFSRDNVPSHPMLQKWVERQIHSELGVQDTPNFQLAVQSFLLAYSEEGLGLPKHGLVNKVHRMNCFFRIWKTSSFWCLDRDHLVPLSLSVQAQLRSIARKGIDSLEHDILKELDDCIAQQGPPKPQERMAIWASMWQLILMYREVLDSFKHLRLTPQNNEAVQTIAAYKLLADSFFPLLTVFYHYQFRTKKSLELSLDWLKPACQTEAIRQASQQMLDSRKEMYQYIQSSGEETDQLLCVFIVNHELKKMNARRRVTKASAKTKAIEDDCEDDAE